MGNISAGDDGFGEHVINEITETERIKKIDCGLYPENYLNKLSAINPDLIIFFDAVNFNGHKTILLKNEELLDNSVISVSTHNLPFSAIYQYLKTNTNADIFFVGVRPASFEKLSQETATVINRVVRVLQKIDKSAPFNIIDGYESLSAALS